MPWSCVGGVSCARAAGIKQSSAGNSSAAAKKRTGCITRLLEPLIPMNALGILPRNARRVVQMTREDLRIHLRKPVQIHTSGRSWLLRWFQGFRRGSLLRFCHQAISQPWPIHFLKIEVTHAVQIFREVCAAGLKLWDRGETSRSRSPCTIRQNFAKRFRAARADHHVLRYRHVEKIPLRDAGAALFPSEGYFKESYVTLVALRSQLIAEERPHQLERFRLLSNP